MQLLAFNLSRNQAKCKIKKEKKIVFSSKVPLGKCSAAMSFQIGFKCVGFFVEGVLILQNKSRKLNTVAGNAILLNNAVSSENISESINTKNRERLSPQTKCLLILQK